MVSIPDEVGVIHAGDPAAFTKLLALPDLAVRSIECADWQATLFIQCRVTAAQAACPTCGTPSTRIHAYDQRTVRDLPWSRYACFLEIQIRRFWCAPCQKPFTERLAAVPPRVRATQRYLVQLVEAAREHSVAHAARTGAVGYKTVERAYYAAAAARFPAAPPPAPVRVLGVDEIAVRKGHGDFKLVVVDHEAARVLEMLPDRSKETLRNYLLSWPTEYRAAVEEVTADFWAGYHEVVAEVLPQARMTGDRFHVQQHVTAALEETRRQVQRTLPRTERAELRAAQGVLRANLADLDAEGRAAVREVARAYPAVGQAHALKERLRRVYEEATSRTNAAKRLGWWIKAARSSGLAAFAPVAEFIERWWQPILNYFVARRSNGRVEGFNTKIKLIKRRAYGFRKDAHFRWRVLMECDGTT